jgi:hypothetical protein
VYNLKTLAIVGGGPICKLAPWSDLTVDIWQMNEAAGKSKQRANAVFQMHVPGVYKDPQNQTDPDHFQWLQAIHGIKIYLQDTDPEIPESVRYPLEEAKKLTEKVLQKGKSDRELKSVELFTFTGCYMIALAVLMGYTSIKIYGIDLIHTEEYRYQRESFMFWVGYAAGRGVEVEIYGADSLFKKPLYGYETFKEFKSMKLGNLERIQMLNILPPTGGLVTMRIVHEMKQALSFSAEEIEEMKIREIPPGATDALDQMVNTTTQTQIKWEKDVEKELEIGETQRKVAQAAFAELDKTSKFTEQLLLLYEKFTYE